MFNTPTSNPPGEFRELSMGNLHVTVTSLDRWLRNLPIDWLDWLVCLFKSWRLEEFFAILCLSSVHRFALSLTLPLLRKLNIIPA